MSKKTMKLIALVGGEEVIVGRCHPGQARILRKAGMAEFDKGKVVLVGSAASTTIRGIEGRFVERGGEIRYERFPSVNWEPDVSAFRKKIDFRESWKEEGVGLELGNWVKPEPTEIKCESVDEWLAELKRRQSLYHFLLPCDDPRARIIGFSF